jgi:hypothetical protein
MGKIGGAFKFVCELHFSPPTFFYQVANPFNFFKIHFGTILFFSSYFPIFFSWKDREESTDSSKERENSSLMTIVTTCEN